MKILKSISLIAAITIGQLQATSTHAEEREPTPQEVKRLVKAMNDLIKAAEPFSPNPQYTYDLCYDNFYTGYYSKFPLCLRLLGEVID